MKKFLPFDRFILETKLSEDEIMKRLSEIIEPMRNVPVLKSKRLEKMKPYTGEFYNSFFKVTRLIRHKNSFIPQISGVITPEKSKTRIAIKMKVHPFVLAFLAFWTIAATLFVAVAIVGQAGIGNFSFEESGLFLLIPIGALLFAYAITMFGFKPEANKSKKYFIELFEARELQYEF